MRYGLRWLARHLAALVEFSKNQVGATVVLFALAIPVLLSLTAGVVDFAEANSAKTNLQNIADSVALSAAAQLRFDKSSATLDRAQAEASGEAKVLYPWWTVTTTVSADAAAGSVTVAQKATRLSLFGSFMPPWTVGVHATARQLSSVPLCVLATAGAQHDVVHVRDSSSVAAPQCMVQSDSDIEVDRAASMAVGAVYAVSSAAGSINPPPITDAPSVADPFSAMDVSIPTICSDTDKLNFSSGTQSLNPGVHCGPVNITGDAKLILNPGEHYFIKGNFHLSGTAELDGTDVTLIFKAHYNLKFDQQATMSLEGRVAGPYAGFVIVTARDYKGSFEIASDRARKLLGTIYLPSTNLTISGEKNTVADQSPWTVIVAQKIQVNGSAKLMLNADYVSTAVPVPKGVGPNGKLRLSD